MDIKTALAKIGARTDLTGEEMRAVMNVIMSGKPRRPRSGPS